MLFTVIKKKKGNSDFALFIAFLPSGSFYILVLEKDNPFCIFFSIDLIHLYLISEKSNITIAINPKSSTLARNSGHVKFIDKYM